MPTPHRTPEDLLARKLRAQEAHLEAQRLQAQGHTKDDPEVQRLVHEAWPWAGEVTGTSAPGIRVVFDEASQSMMLFDAGGFLTCVGTPGTLWKLLQAEAETPGFNRRRLVKGAPGDLAVQAVLRAEAQAKSEPKVRKFTPEGRERLSLSDLDLEI